MITGSQIRAARALLGWTTQKLADASGVHYATLSRAEQTDGIPNMRAHTLATVQAALEGGGCQFFDGNYSGNGGPGVRLVSESA
ncbi:helix-turn-helix transcriptional regulator [Mesorhizobium sp. WSM3873]|uniref:helix-turn-helix domain-containing protein n=1 Tax=Mesorhizobium sp. WSM3873 TaxID=1854056 RepID=UPI0007FE4D3E|nr:helix-turn-helix transcriptional regulator [Mesorhizobium sp. WSM3873]OBQ83183.1 hypothetical protein A9K71_25270 [Mesorhizobium sp. WSM3873]